MPEHGADIQDLKLDRGTCTLCGGATDGQRCGCYDVVLAFKNAMLAELASNAEKGGRDGQRGWINGDPRWLLAEVFDHAAKLQLAAVEHMRRERGMIHRPLPWGDRDTASLVREFAADTANMAMMLADRLGVLEPA